MARSSLKRRGHAGLLSAFDGRLLSAGVICFHRSVMRARNSGLADGGGGTAKPAFDTCHPCGSLYCTCTGMRYQYNTSASSYISCSERSTPPPASSLCAIASMGCLRRWVFVVDSATMAVAAARVGRRVRREVRDGGFLSEAADAH
jgi:hypothetical protein